MTEVMPEKLIEALRAEGWQVVKRHKNSYTRLCIHEGKQAMSVVVPLNRFASHHACLLAHAVKTIEDLADSGARANRALAAARRASWDTVTVWINAMERRLRAEFPDALISRGIESVDDVEVSATQDGVTLTASFCRGGDEYFFVSGVEPSGPWAASGDVDLMVSRMLERLGHE